MLWFKAAILSNSTSTSLSLSLSPSPPLSPSRDVGAPSTQAVLQIPTSCLQTGPWPVAPIGRLSAASSPSLCISWASLSMPPAKCSFRSHQCAIYEGESCQTSHLAFSNRVWSSASSGGLKHVVLVQGRDGEWNLLFSHRFYLAITNSITIVKSNGFFLHFRLITASG